ncbi:MAG: hypothetical protein KAG19_06955 [Methylococcales bacterium]|nr:hypothetical protein [Methylococcales bacterium]
MTMQCNKLNNNLGFSILALSLVASSVVKADGDYPNWSVKGFGSIGLARSDNNTIGFYRDRTSTRAVKKSFDIATDSRLGLQLDVDINDDWHFTTQFIARDHAGNFFEQNLDWAFIKWSPTAFDGLEVRAGRLGVDAFLLSDYRNVGYAYPWIRPPQDFYANIPLTHYDGLDIKKTFFLEDGELAFKVGAGYTSTRLSEYYLNLDLEGPFLMANVVYATGDWRFRAGYGHIWQTEDIEDKNFYRLRDAMTNPVNNFLIPNLNELTSVTHMKDTSLQFMSLGTAYDDGTWLVHAETSFIKEDGQQAFNPDVVSAYLSIGRRISDVTLHARYGVAHSFHKTVNAPDINPALVGSEAEPFIRGMSQQLVSGLNEQAIEQQSLSIGLRWDFYQKMAFKAEWTHYWLGDNGEFSSLWQYEEPRQTTPNHVNLVSFGIDFIF